MPPGTRILIVDDEETFAENLWDYFRKRLAEVKVVASGEAAIEVAQEFKPDVLIMDYGLPGMNGLETYSRLKQLPLRYGCVLITGDASEAIPQAAHASGIRCVLEKPFAFSELEGVIAPQPIVPATGIESERRASWTRRAGERRCGQEGGPVPFVPGGSTPHERRQTERRSKSDRRHNGRH
jgi:CheY-like chemotaxis protein